MCDKLSGLGMWLSWRDVTRGSPDDFANLGRDFAKYMFWVVGGSAAEVIIKLPLTAVR